MSDDTSRKPERPRVEPEIIPPDRMGGRGDGYVWISRGQGSDGQRRIYIAKPGPFSIIVALLLAGLALAAIVLVIAGVILFWIPAIVFIVAALLLAGYSRYYWARLKHWFNARRIG